MERGLRSIGLLALLSFLLMGGVFWAMGSTYFGNRVEHEIREIDDRTNYDTLKKVEDTARAMIANYKSDLVTYEAYKNSDSREERSWATQALIRANKTANTYNEYILKNSYVWRDNVPDDIDMELAITKGENE